MKRPSACIILFILFLAACMSAPAGNGVSTPNAITAIAGTVIPEPDGTEPPLSTPEPPTRIPTLPGGYSPTELKYRVLEEFPEFFFCDPDFYPVAHSDEMVLARERFPQLQANPEEFQAILEHTGLSGLTDFTDEQKLLVYQEHKKLDAIPFDPAGESYQFQVRTGQEGLQGSLITGTIDAGGSIEILDQEASLITCPICLAAGTLIDTPRGPVQVEKLRVGDPVWTLDEAGRRVPAFIASTGRTGTPATHRMYHVVLSDGRELQASPGHPTADGLRLGDLQPGDILDDARVVRVEWIRYEEAYTYDILPSGTTGFYWSNRILIGSTLAELKEE